MIVCYRHDRPWQPMPAVVIPAPIFSTLRMVAVLLYHHIMDSVNPRDQAYLEEMYQPQPSGPSQGQA
jgi:hypothetical protein